jgi:2-C-methyl-D-erythritol 4-phosphate cytidylyltransferase
MVEFSKPMIVSEIAIIVLAAGKGERFGGLKQFTKINGIATVFQTVNTLLSFKISCCIIIVVPLEKVKYAQNYYKKNKKVVIISGGSTRYESTKNAVDFLIQNKPVKYAYVHDGVRPFISKSLFIGLYQAMIREKTDGSVLYLPTTDSVIFFENLISKNSYLDRKKTMLLQTPHLYSLKELSTCLGKNINNQYKEMENAQKMEFSNRKISYVLGSRGNIKLTYRHEVKLFKNLLNSKWD